MITDSFEPLEIQQLEYAFLLEKTSSTADKFKLNIPKIMPLIERSTPIKLKKVFNDNIFANAVACRPNGLNNVHLQNYLTVEPFRNTDFAYKENAEGFIDVDDTFIVSFMNKNVRDVKITDNI